MTQTEERTKERMPTVKFIEKHILVQMSVQQKEAAEAISDAARCLNYVLGRMEKPEDSDSDVIFAELEGANEKLDLARRRMATIRGLKLSLGGVRRAK